MRHEFSLRFEPASGAKFVQAQAYVRALEAALEGLTSLRAALAPELATKHGWPLPQVRDALTFSIGPTAKGSLMVPLVAGGGDKGPQLASDVIAQAFWKETGLELGRVAKGRAARLSATGAEAFARASAAAKDSSAKLSFATKTGRGTWKSVAAITPLEAALRKHAASQRKGHRATTSMSGQIVSLTYDPPGFILATSATRRTVRMPSSLRDRAGKLWGEKSSSSPTPWWPRTAPWPTCKPSIFGPPRRLRRRTRASTKPSASCVAPGTVLRSVLSWARRATRPVHVGRGAQLEASLVRHEHGLAVDGRRLRLSGPIEGTGPKTCEAQGHVLRIRCNLYVVAAVLLRGSRRTSKH